MKKLSNLGKALNKAEQQQVFGGARKKRCYPGTDPQCCGTAAWQCGVGPSSGGYLSSNQQYCNCV